ncbi:MAG TPA: RluA family pseudouridine synthase [Kofleriaceae bacterium]
MVTSHIQLFDPQPAAAELPVRMPSPFASEPHPIALRAARELVAALPDEHRREARDGKMFGALVVRSPDGRIGYLRAFSGMLGGAWELDGFVPPAFDRARRDAFWPAGEAELAELAAREIALADDPARAVLAAIRARHAGELAALQARHRDRRAARRDARAAGLDDHALAQESRGDTAERRRLLAAHAAELAPIADLDLERRTVAERRAARSRELLAAIHATYDLRDACGNRRELADLFDAPPGGAGDCAAPKLLAHAYRLGLAPIALAEIWIGASTDRIAGRCYPACRGKCGPILAHMLAGTGAEPPPLFGGDAIDPAEPRIVFEDAWLAVVAKPVGLLSVPGRSGALRDSAQTRLRARFGDAHVVHRLDLDTSGLLLVAKDAATHAALQRAFAIRAIDKRYVAILDGAPTAEAGAAEAGTIELPLRVDLDDRPRQLVDAVYGKAARTEWRVVSREPTRVALVPRTGRTHQLRVHCAVGLGAPIAGDRLYGRAGARLLLHAEALAFVHPHTGERVAFEWPAPF